MQKRPGLPGRFLFLNVIARQRVGAKRRPTTGSAKQSTPQRAELWIASLRSQ
jgi:hypothetical protein